MTAPLRGAPAMGDPHWVNVDWTGFDPRRIQSVSHRLMQHPLFGLGSLMELGRRLEAVGRVRSHSHAATAGTSFDNAPKLHPNPRSAAETLASLNEANAWMSLLNIQTDDLYRTLVDDVLEELRPQVEKRDPGMCYRGGWIFVTSPRAVTPFHMDKEHNFILQIVGRKRVYVWDHRDTRVVSERARDLFHAWHARDLVQWREEFRERAQVFDLEPGQGAYMPSTSPHMVENGDGPSVTASFTYYTDSTRRVALVHAAHHRVRALGLRLPAVGRFPVADAATHVAARVVRGCWRAAQQLRGRSVPKDDLAYARHGAY